MYTSLWSVTAFRSLLFLKDDMFCDLQDMNVYAIFFHLRSITHVLNVNNFED